MLFANNCNATLNGGITAVATGFYFLEHKND